MRVQRGAHQARRARRTRHQRYGERGQDTGADAHRRRGDRRDARVQASQSLRIGHLSPRILSTFLVNLSSQPTSAGPRDARQHVHHLQRRRLLLLRRPRREPFTEQALVLHEREKRNRSHSTVEDPTVEKVRRHVRRLDPRELDEHAVTNRRELIVRPKRLVADDVRGQHVAELDALRARVLRRGDSLVSGHAPRQHTA